MVGLGFWFLKPEYMRLLYTDPVGSKFLTYAIISEIIGHSGDPEDGQHQVLGTPMLLTYPVLRDGFRHRRGADLGGYPAAYRGGESARRPAAGTAIERDGVVVCARTPRRTGQGGFLNWVLYVVSLIPGGEDWIGEVKKS